MATDNNPYVLKTQSTVDLIAFCPFFFNDNCPPEHGDQRQLKLKTVLPRLKITPFRSLLTQIPEHYLRSLTQAKSHYLCCGKKSYLLQLARAAILEACAAACGAGYP